MSNWKIIRSIVFVLLLYPNMSAACIITEGPVEQRALAFSESCFDFVINGERPVTSNWISSKEKRVSHKLFGQFNQYEEFLEISSNNCPFSVEYAAIGFEEKNNRRICHIAYQKPSSFNLLSKRYSFDLERRVEFLEHEIKEKLILDNEARHTQQNGIGTTEIMASEYCLEDSQYGTVSLRSSEITPSNSKEAKTYSEWRQSLGAPIQHIYFTNDTCIQPTK